MAIYKTKNPTKDGRQYFFRVKYKDIKGEIHDYASKKFKTLKEATTEESLYRIKIQNQETYTSEITLEQIFYEYLEKRKKELKKQSINKIDVLYRHIKIISNQKINDIDLKTYNQLYNYIDNLPFKAHYKNRIMGLFKTLIIYSNKYYNTSIGIIKYIEHYKDINEIKKEMQFFTYDQFIEFEKVIDVFEWKAFFRILYFMGLRQGELQALTWNDVNFKNSTITINKTLTTKLKGENWTVSTPKTKNSNRILPFPKIIENDLKLMFNNAKNYSDFKYSWFVFGNSIPFKETTICKYKNNYCKLANVPQIRIHDFRHSCASFLINKGASIALVSKYLGHSNITITLNTYTHMYQSELMEMTNIINNM